MKIPGKAIQDELPNLKKDVTNSYQANRENCRRFNKFRKFIYETSLSAEEKAVNNELGRPNLEANVLTAYQSRLCGEFSKQEPGIEIAADEGSKVDPKVLQAVEGHIRHILDEAKRSNTQYNTYRDSISGGFCTFKVFTEYANERSLKQVIKVRKAKFPTMCGYDPLATEPHKGDGDYEFEVYPRTKRAFKEEYPKVDIDELKFTSSLGEFSWSFNTGTEDVLLICNLFKKKKKKVEIVELADERVMTVKEYEDLIANWQEMEVPPAVVEKRWSTTTTICQYIFIENKILEYNETDFNRLPLPFVDGDSIEMYDEEKASIKQMTRPYAYNAEGAQRLKNLGVQCLAGYLENMSQHKYIVKKEAIPQEKSYQEAMTNLQKASTLVVNAFKDNDPNQPIPEPIIPITPAAAPPEISNSISMADTIIQNELGSYDAQLGINDNQLSGVAIVEAATQSQSAAMPYVVNYIIALNEVALIIVDLIPKYYKTTMTIPIIDKEGKRSSVKINPTNGEEGLDFNYDSNQLQVKVTAGVNFAIQKSRALNQLIAMCKAAPGFATFIEKKGLQVLIDNFEVRGTDILKELAEEYEQEQAQMQQQQMQMQQEMMQNNPKLMGEHTKAFNAQANAALGEEKLKLEREKMDLDREIAYAQRDAALAKAEAEEARAEAEKAKAHASEYRANAEVAIKTKEMHHRHGKETIETLHKIDQAENDRITKEKEMKSAS